MGSVDGIEMVRTPGIATFFNVEMCDPYECINYSKDELKIQRLVITLKIKSS